MLGHQVSLICWRMHMYLGLMYPPLIEPSATGMTTPGQYHILQNAHIPRADVPPTNQTSAREPDYTRSVLHIVQCTHTQARCTPLLIELSQYHILQNADIQLCQTMSVWYLEEYRHTWPIGNLTYSEIGWSLFCLAYKTPSSCKTQRGDNPQKHISWVNNSQLTQITYAALYKHEDYFQSTPIYSYPSTSILMYYNTPRYYFQGTGRFTPPPLNTSALHLFLQSFHVYLL